MKMTTDTNVHPSRDWVEIIGKKIVNFSFHEDDGSLLFSTEDKKNFFFMTTEEMQLSNFVDDKGSIKDAIGGTITSARTVVVTNSYFEGIVLMAVQKTVLLKVVTDSKNDLFFRWDSIVRKVDDRDRDVRPVKVLCGEKDITDEVLVESDARPEKKPNSIPAPKEKTTMRLKPLVEMRRNLSDEVRGSLDDVFELLAAENLDDMSEDEELEKARTKMKEANRLLRDVAILLRDALLAVEEEQF